MPSSPPPPPIGDGEDGGGEARSCGSPSPTPSVLRRMRKVSPQPQRRKRRPQVEEVGLPYLLVPSEEDQIESDGMIESLHETLGNANPHYTRMAREKIAARKAATKAMEARKSAMVEAAWCRILHAARIQNKDAEENMEKAKLRATEAFQEATEIGVMMYGRPDCSNQQYEVESSHTGGQSTHKVTASFQTGFEVDMEVAAAVKKAFIQLANSSDSSKKEEFKELLWKISQNPDATEIDANTEDEQCHGDCNNENKRNLKFNKQTLRAGIFPSDLDSTNVQQSYDLVSIMLERLKALHEDELASLAVIVATSGLNAALQRGKYQETESVNNISAAPQRSHSRRYSTAASFVDILEPRKEGTSELPSLDKFLVKHLSKLQKEVEEARKASRKAYSGNSCAQGQTTGRNPKSQDSASDLGSILVKHVSKLEKEILEAKENNSHIQPLEESCMNIELHVKEDASKEESEVYKAQSESCNSNSMGGLIPGHHMKKASTAKIVHKTNRIKLYFHINYHHLVQRINSDEAAKLEALKSFCTKDGNTFDVGLDKIFVKPVHRLEREKKKALEHGQTNVQKDPQKIDDNTTVTGSLDEILVKHECTGEGLINVSHDQILAKHVPRLEKEKMEHEKSGDMISSVQRSQDDCFCCGRALRSSFNPVEERGRAKEKELMDAWGGVGLGNVMKPHVSKIERDKIEWRKAEEEQRQMCAPGTREL
uniref:Uncharacterized protein n=2 Tax=Leersia perrieri TaxID=77586 RepID=A0A0D9VW92_9ORYZ